MKVKDEVFAKIPGYFTIHSAFRRDLERLRSIAEMLDRYNQDNWNALEKWFDLHKDAIVHHHHAEDHFFFPEVEKRTHEELPKHDTLLAQHHKVDDYMVQFDTAIHQKDREMLKDVIKGYAKDIEEHLTLEENVWIPFVLKLEDAQIHEIEAEYSKNLMKEYGIKKMMANLGWMLENNLDRQTKKYFLAMIPLPGRLIYKFKAKKQNERLLNSLIA